MLFVASLRRILAISRISLPKVIRSPNQILLLHLQCIQYLLLIGLVLQLISLLLYALAEVLLDSVDVSVHSASSWVETHSWRAGYEARGILLIQRHLWECLIQELEWAVIIHISWLLGVGCSSLSYGGALSRIFQAKRVLGISSIFSIKGWIHISIIRS